MNNNPSPKKRQYKHSFVILLMLISTFFYYKSSPLQPIIPENELFEMLNNGEVERIVLVKKEDFLKITLTEKALELSKHKERFNIYSNPKNKEYLTRLVKKILSKDNVHYIVKIGSYDRFDKHFQDNAKKNSQKSVNLTIDDKDNLYKGLSDGLNLLVFFTILWIMFGSLINNFAKDGPLFGIGGSKAILRDKENKVKTTFKDVGGMLEAKEELKEIVDFLKNPKKYTQLGGRIPKGALLVGAPGNGKTLLAKAVAGEADVPFFSSSGSDYVTMFVGAGVSSIHQTFKQARKAGKENHASIIFIDEIDSIGRSRRRSIGDNVAQDGENTLNALLTEMDGFNTDNTTNQNTIIVLAATNRVEVLDKALLRPGRFDRQISIDNPTLKDREAIFKLHMKDLKLLNNVSAATLATQTVGYSGAFIANICNEAALHAARKNRKKINMNDFQVALDRAIGGLEKKGKLISDKEKNIVAWHEGGHAVASWFTEHATPLIKVTIVPRGVAALGYAQYLPKEQFIYQQNQIQAKIDVLLAGRVAEKMKFNQLSTGAQNDLEHLTNIAYNMVAVYGMSSQVGHISFRKIQEEQVYNLTKPYAEATSKIIDAEVRKITTTAYKRVQNLLEKNKEALSIVAKALLKKEVLYRKDIEKLIGPRPFEKDIKKAKITS